MKEILLSSGYDNYLSIKNIGENDILLIENYANRKLSDVIKNLNCCFSDIYKVDIEKKQFQFVPGHRSIMLNFCEYASPNEPFTYLKNLEEMCTSLKNQPEFSNLLKELMESALRNFKKSPNNYRYSEVIQHFCTYIYIMCGRHCYETISGNLSVPAATTVLKYIQEHKVKIMEGKLRCDELKTYLQKINAPNCVWLSEDGSGIIQRVSYDVASNQLVGLLLPLDECTGMPKHSTYSAENLALIEEHMKNQVSSLVYVIMAQPVKENVPPFMLQIFGTDNSFRSSDVLNRWKYIREELDK